MKKYLYLILFFLVCVPAIAGTINSYTLKSPPDDADTIVIYDSDDGSTKKTTVGDISSGGVAASGWTDGGANVYLTDSTDSVGMGTHTPSSKLQVVGSVTATTYIGDGSALTGISSGGWSDNGTSVVLATSTDNVGIGSTSPISALDTGNGVITSKSIANDQVYNVKKYGAKGDGIELVDGAIISGTDDFTSASATFTSADVGKVITIYDAGGTSVDLTTTIAAYVDAHSITLTDNASATVSGAIFRYGTDDTEAINNAIAAIYDGGNGSLAGTVFFPSGIYIVNGAFNKVNNSQIGLPTVPLSEPAVSVTLLGATPPAFNNRRAIGGSTIYGTRYGTDGSYSIISGKNAGELGDLTGIRVHLENLKIRTVQDPTHTAINLEDVGMASGKNLDIDTSLDISSTVVLQTHNDSYGLKVPGGLNGNVGARWESIKIKRFYNGVFVGEHSNWNDLMVVYAVNAIVFNASNYIINMQYVSIERCVTLLSFPIGTTLVNIQNLDAEKWGSGSHVASTDIYDPNNYAKGSLVFNLISFSGASAFISVEGGANLSRISPSDNGSLRNRYNSNVSDGFYFRNSNSDSTTSGAGLLLQQDDGTAVSNGTRLGTIAFQGAYNTSNSVNTVAGISVYSDQDYSTSSTGGASMAFLTAPNGSGTRLERVRITNGGNVGIGTINPSSLLQVGATNTSAFRVTSGGNVGIGTTAPGATLDIGTGSLRIGIGTTTAGTLVCVKSISSGTSILGYCTGSLTDSICGTCN